MKLAKKKLFIFGGIKLYQYACPSCKEKTLTKNIIFSCRCGYSEEKEREASIKKIICGGKRKGPSKKLKKELILKQENKCFWCGREIGEFIIKKDRIVKLRPHYDHILPYSVYNNNERENFCLSCNICNSFKHSKLFNSVEQCKEHLKNRWEICINSKIIELVK